MARYRSERCLRTVVLAALVLAGCADDPRPHAYAKAPVIEELGPEIEAAAARGPEALAAYFDWTGLTERVAPDGLDGPTRRAFLTGVEEGLRGQGTNGLIDQIAAGTYSYRGVSWRNGLPHARFRFLPPQGGFNFHDLLLERDASGAVRVVDLYVLTSGEYVSETVRRAATAMLGDDSSPLARLVHGRRLSSLDLAQLGRFVEATRADDPEGALLAFDTLPPVLRRERSLLLLRVQAASQLGDDTRYLAILDETAAQMPRDLTLRVLMIDAYFLREDWSACLAAALAVEAEYPDPYLVALEARIRTRAGDPVRGLALADRAITEEDALIDAHDSALLASLALGDRERAIHERARLVDEHGVDMAILAGEPGYEGLRTLDPIEPRGSTGDGR